MEASFLTNRRRTRTVFSNFAIQENNFNQGCISRISIQPGGGDGRFITSVEEGAANTTCAELQVLLQNSSCFPIVPPQPSGPTYTFLQSGGVIIGYTGTLASYIEIPSSIDTVTITGIGSNLFFENTNIVTVIIPTTVTLVESQVFYRCTNLNTLVFPNSLTSFGIYLCAFCTKLVNVTLPTSLTSINDFAFGSCSSLSTLTIPSTVTSVGQFAFTGCSALTTLIFNTVTAPTFGTNALATFGPSSSKIYIPSTATNPHLTAWSSSATAAGWPGTVLRSV